MLLIAITLPSLFFALFLSFMIVIIVREDVREKNFNLSLIIIISDEKFCFTCCCFVFLTFGWWDKQTNKQKKIFVFASYTNKRKSNLVIYYENMLEKQKQKFNLSLSEVRVGKITFFFLSRNLYEFWCAWECFISDCFMKCVHMGLLSIY